MIDLCHHHPHLHRVAPSIVGFSIGPPSLKPTGPNDCDGLCRSRSMRAARGGFRRVELWWNHGAMLSHAVTRSISMSDVNQVPAAAPHVDATARAPHRPCHPSIRPGDAPQGHARIFPPVAARAASSRIFPRVVEFSVRAVSPCPRPRSRNLLAGGQKPGWCGVSVVPARHAKFHAPLRVSNDCLNMPQPAMATGVFTCQTTV